MMEFNLSMVFENEKRQFINMTEEERFKYFLLLQFNATYKLGAENLEKSDCSGAVCLALAAATGHLIRITANDLFQRVFTVEHPSADCTRAAFFVNRSGRAGHVAGLVGDDAVLNSQEGGAKVRGLEGLSKWFLKKGVTTVIRGLDRAALINLAYKGRNRYDLDEDLHDYFRED
jgi:murein DD-endopeptidase